MKISEFLSNKKIFRYAQNDNLCHPERSEGSSYARAKKYNFLYNEKGFTLIEVLIVVILVSILAVMAIPRFNTPEIRVRSLSRQIMDDMRFARTKAVTDSKDVEVVFTSPTNCVIEYKTSPVPPIKNGAGELALYGITCAPVATFTFSKIGSVSGPASLVVTKDTYNITITVVSSTGMVYKDDD